MASDKKKKKKTNASPPGALISAITRTVFTLLALVVILSVSAFLFARTDGFRSLVSDQIEKAVGVRLEADSSRTTWNGAIVFRNVRSAGHEGLGLIASKVRVETDLAAAIRGKFVEALRAVQVQDWRLQFSMDDAGIWQPAGLGKISAWLQRWGSLALPADEPVELPPTDAAKTPGEDPAQEVRPRVKLAEFNQTRLHIQNGELIWRDRSGSVLAEIRGVTFKLTPLDLPTSPAAHYHLQVESAAAADGSKIRNMDVELFRTGLTYFVINLEAARQTARRPEAMDRSPRPAADPEPDRTESTSRARDESAQDPEHDVLEELIREKLRDALREG